MYIDLLIRTLEKRNLNVRKELGHAPYERRVRRVCTHNNGLKRKQIIDEYLLLSRH